MDLILVLHTVNSPAATSMTLRVCIDSRLKMFVVSRLGH